MTCENQAKLYNEKIQFLENSLELMDNEIQKSNIEELFSLRSDDNNYYTITDSSDDKSLISLSCFEEDIALKISKTENLKVVSYRSFLETKISEFKKLRASLLKSY